MSHEKKVHVFIDKCILTMANHFILCWGVVSVKMHSLTYPITFYSSFQQTKVLPVFGLFLDRRLKDVAILFILHSRSNDLVYIMFLCYCLSNDCISINGYYLTWGILYLIKVYLHMNFQVCLLNLPWFMFQSSVFKAYPEEIPGAALCLLGREFAHIPPRVLHF